MTYLLHGVIVLSTWMVHGVFCHNVSLSNGNHGTVYIDGKTLCGYSFDKKAAMVVCRHLNYTDAVVLPRNDALHSDKMELKCNGNESSVADCDLKVVFCSRSRHYYYKAFGPADVLCYNQNTNDAGSVELVRNVGRVTVNMYGIAAAVCSDTFDDKAARVTCRMKGYTDGVAFDINKSAYEDYVLFGGVLCTGNERSLMECNSSGTENCKQAYAASAGVMCYNEEGPTVQFDGDKGLYEVIVDHRLAFYCKQGQFYPHNRYAPHRNPPKETIACKHIIFVDKEEQRPKRKRRPSIFPKYRLGKTADTPLMYNCHGGWMYELRWWWRAPESFICGSPHKSSGTLFTRS